MFYFDCGILLQTREIGRTCVDFCFPSVSLIESLHRIGEQQQLGSMGFKLAAAHSVSTVISYTKGALKGPCKYRVIESKITVYFQVSLQPFLYPLTPVTDTT